MKTKIELKNIAGSLLFEFECEGNTLLKTLVEAVRKRADLRGADLQGADLRGAYLQGADLQGAYLSEPIKRAIVFTGLYEYVVIPYVTDKEVKRIKMGCYDRSLAEWNENFWNNEKEFPNDGSEKSQFRLMAFETAKKWFDIVSPENKTV